MSGEAWPVASSPATGHPPAERRPSESIDIDELLDWITRRLVEPAPIRDKALEDS